MWRFLLGALFGPCGRCPEKDARITALERANQDLLDRLMSRDYSQLAFVRAQTAAAAESSKTGDAEEFAMSGDGLDS